MQDSFINHPVVLGVFGVGILSMLILDLGVFNKKSHKVGTKEAGIWTAVWIGLSMAFSFLIYKTMGTEKFAQFQTAYWIEKALSVDNLFVFILVFGFFKVPEHLHHKVLFWGIIGALLFRAIFIFSGVGLINLTYLPEMKIFGEAVKINVVLAIFGLFLVYAGIKSWGGGDDDEEKDFSQSAGARLINKIFKGRVTPDYHEDKFIIKKKRILGSNVRLVKFATPLLVVLAVVEFTDLLFAVDSIPAIFAVSDDPFILYTSNIFAILGLRSMYFLLSNFIHMFSKLPYGLSIILTFIGVKMVIAPWIHISSTLSLSIVLGILVISVIWSLLSREEKRLSHE